MSTDDPAIFAPTPLHSQTATLSRANLWTPWFGYTVAAAYGDVVEEAGALARGCGISDFAPYPLYEISGADAGAYLDRLLTQPASPMAVGEVKPVLLCASTGHVISLGTVMRATDQHFLLMAACEIGARLEDARASFAVEAVRSPLVPIALFGPARESVLRHMGLNYAPGDEGFIAGLEHNGVSLLVADLPSALAPGGGGSLVFTAAPDAGLEWDRLLRRGREAQIVPVGLNAIERRRIDLGVPREGFEFRAASLALNPEDRALPAELGLDRFVDLDGRAFTGAKALASASPARELVRVEVDRVMPLKGQEIRAGREVIGRVTSTYRAAELGITRGLALVAREARQGPLTVGPAGSVIPIYAAAVDLS
jgi:aminomethyltransferase